ncbi:MAG: bifunctional 2-polyprenyl-6-hydroxyphenol methylase/3-demethylubiquinol 3-O-methyltransferase UbiG [Pseudomonadota bacterium]|nr:bifunctional 2-polyprenyl-6-hydroxyphenol methylase/3-demethylubiquinol 3-O-methyltransferase UbiG [Pseudomonadota bacterium]
MPTHKAFTEQPNTWWDPTGPFWTLHAINPLRLDYILSHINSGIALDVGCGGGILSESLARHFTVTGIDTDKSLLSVAQAHAKSQSLDINYQHNLLEEIAPNHQEKFDLVTCLEVLEHVDHPEKVVSDIVSVTKPGGFVFFSTLNRNLISFLGAIIAAEYILKILPKHTHEYRKFITPAELIQNANQAGLELKNLNGILYNPLFKTFSIGQLTTINYIACFQKPLAP